jgi:MFS family permease
MVAGSVLAGALIGRAGRYRLTFMAAAALLGAGAHMFTQVCTGTSAAALAAWMLLLGLGLGPTLSGLTIAIAETMHASVAHHNVGPATSALATAAVIPRLAVVGAVALALTAAFLPRYAREPARAE